MDPKSADQTSGATTGAVPQPVATPTAGRIVHYRLPQYSPYAGAVRPAVVAQVHGGTHVNLVVFKGQTTDLAGGDSGVFAGAEQTSPTALVGSVAHAEAGENKPGTWHWPERTTPGGPPRPLPPPQIDRAVTPRPLPFG